MTTDERIARRKLSLLELAQDLGNVSRACKLVGYSRQQFYEIRRNYQTYGAAGLVDKVKGAKEPAPEPGAPEIEEAILDHALEHPTMARCASPTSWPYAASRSARAACAGSGVRHDLLTKHERLLRLERITAERADRAHARAGAGCWSGSARSSASATSRPRTPARWSRSTPSSSAC